MLPRISRVRPAASANHLSVASLAAPRSGGGQLTRGLPERDREVTPQAPRLRSIAKDASTDAPG